MAKSNDNELKELVDKTLKALLCEDCQHQYAKIAEEQGVSIAEIVQFALQAHIAAHHIYTTLEEIGFEIPGGYGDESGTLH